MKNLVNATWLFENMDQVILVDATSNFLDANEGKLKYKEKHIPGAFHMDLDIDLCGKVKEHGGRHPLPEDMNEFAKKLENIGINNESNIVVYDEGIMYAARFWWMCKYIGLENVKVLNGGISAWINEGNEVTSELTPLPTQKGKIKIHLNKNMFIDYNDIRNVLLENTNKTAIIDSRSNERYKGINESVDPKAGHIPNALNYFFTNVLDEENKYQDVAFLKNYYKDLINYDELILYCGSGVSAAINILALDEINISSKLYIGSWSDYISYEDAIIVKED